MDLKEALLYKKLEDRKVHCFLCSHHCTIPDGKFGICRVRENKEGILYTHAYGELIAQNIDPIEKKPLYHFFPGSTSYSIATMGCNFQCGFCQNWQISQVRPEQVESFDLPPDAVAAAAEKYECPSVAYTYTEPVVFFEYMSDSAVAARRKRIRNLVVTGGHVKPEPLRDLLEVVDAIKIDLKSFSKDFYAEYVRGDLEAVLEAIRIVAGSKVWLEVVYLVIPTLNDSPVEIREMSRWLKAEAGPDVPLHFSRFQPMYLVKNLPPTPISTLERSRGIALEEGLRYVYIGNVPGHEAESTSCPDCRRVVVARSGYAVRKNDIRSGKCGFCGAPIPGIWA